MAGEADVNKCFCRGKQSHDTSRQTDRQSQGWWLQDTVQCVFSLTGSVSYHSEPNELVQTGPGKPAAHHTYVHGTLRRHTTLKKTHTYTPSL